MPGKPYDPNRPYTRCHWFNDDGSKRMQRNDEWGCRYSSCYFVHPDHPRWDNLRPTPHPNAEKERQAVGGDEELRARLSRGPDWEAVQKRAREREEREREREEREKERERERERQREQREREREKDRERARERERGRERERERERDERERERDRPRSPPRAGPSTQTGPSMSSSYAASRDPRTRPASGSFTAPSAPGNRALSPRAPSRPDLPNKPLPPPLSRADSMSRTQTQLATPIASSGFGRNDTGMSRTASGASLTRSSYSDRGSYRDADKERDRDRDRDRDRYGDRSLPPNTPSEPRSRAAPTFVRSRQGSTAASLAPQTPPNPPAARSPVPSALPPPPQLRTTPPIGTAASPVVTSTQTVVKTDANASVAGLTRQDKIQVWADRIKVLAEAVQARTQHVAAEREVTQLRALANSQKYGNLSDSAREKMDKKVNDAEERVAQKRTELNACVYKLVDNDFWDLPLSWQAIRGEQKTDPKGKGKQKEPAWNIKEAEAEQQFRELRTVVWQVRDGVSELYKMMGEVRNASSPTSALGLSTDDQKTDDDKRPAKRRRTSDAGAEDASSVARSSTLATSSAAPAPSVRTPDPAPPVPSAPTAPSKEVEDLMDRLYTLDDRVSELENTMIQFDSEVLGELEHRMEERFREMTFGDVETAPEEGMDVDQPQGAGAERPEGEGAPQNPRTILERLQGVEQEIQRAGEEISAIADEIAQIIRQSRYQETEVERLTKENEELKTRVAEMERRFEENTELMRTYKSETDALNAALQAYINRPASPPPAPPPAPPLPPQIPDLQSIAELIRPMVLERIRNDVYGPMREMHDEVEQTIKVQNAQVAQNLMSKLQLTFQTVQVIYNWMNQSVAAQTQQAAAAPAQPHVHAPVPAPALQSGPVHQPTLAQQLTPVHQPVSTLQPAPSHPPAPSHVHASAHAPYPIAQSHSHSPVPTTSPVAPTSMPPPNNVRAANGVPSSSAATNASNAMHARQSPFVQHAPPAAHLQTFPPS